MARLWGEIKAFDSSREKEASRLASQKIEARLAVGKGNAYSHTWERDIYVEIHRDGSIFVGVQENNVTVQRIELGPIGQAKV